MDKITVETDLGGKLRGLAGSAVLCDASVRVVGFFSPVAGQVRLEDLQLEPPSTIAKIDAMRKDRTGKPLEEIRARLGVK